MELSHLEKHTLKSIAQLSSLEETGLAFEAQEELQKRLLNIEPLEEEKSVRIFFASDGLNLENKMQIETNLLTHLRREFPDIDVSLYFKRILPGKETRISAPPKDVPPNKPFGLNIQRKAIPYVKEIIVVASGKGGVGKSTCPRFDSGRCHHRPSSEIGK